MSTITLSDLRTEIRDLGDYANSAKFTSAYLNTWINKAIRAYHDYVVETHEGYYDKTNETLVTVAGTQTVTLPSDHYRLRLLERKLAADRYAPLRRLTLAETSRFSGRGAPRGYMLHGGGSGAAALPGTVRLWPVPDGAYTLRVTYIPTATALSADGDVFAFLPGGDAFVVHEALLALDRREGRPLQARLDAVAAAKLQIKAAAAHRDSGEPEYLVPRAGTFFEEGDD